MGSQGKDTHVNFIVDEILSKQNGKLPKTIKDLREYTENVVRRAKKEYSSTGASIIVLQWPPQPSLHSLLFLP